MARRGPKDPPPPTPAPAGKPTGLRLQRLLADAGVASRRECEAMIERGLVEVNGRVESRLPIFIDPAKDRVKVDGRAIHLNRAREAGPGARRAEGPVRVYIMLNKPDRVLCTTRDEAAAGAGGDPDAGRTTVIDLVKDRSGARLYPVGRLDYHSTGLVLLTNDGALADRLTHARYGVTRTYRVTIKGHVRPDMLDDLRRRVGKETAPASSARPGDTTESNSGRDGVRVAREPGEDSTTTVLEVTLREGKSRQLSAILEQMGCIVRKLIRVGIGPLRLFGVAIGESRNLTREEVEGLMVAGGLRRARPVDPRPPARPTRPTRSPRPSRNAGRTTDPRRRRPSKGPPRKGRR